MAFKKTNEFGENTNIPILLTEECKVRQLNNHKDPWAEITPNKIKNVTKASITETNGRISGIDDRLFENTQFDVTNKEENLWEILDSIRTSESDWNSSRAWKCPKGRKHIQRSSTENYLNEEKDKKNPDAG